MNTGERHAKVLEAIRAGVADLQMVDPEIEVQREEFDRIAPVAAMVIVRVLDAYFDGRPQDVILTPKSTQTIVEQLKEAWTPRPSA